MDGTYNLKDWTMLATQQVLADDIVAAVHIDELIGYSGSKHLIKSLVDLLEEISLILEQLNTSGLSIYLSVELSPKSIYPLKFNNSLSWIEQEVMPRSVPEIIIYKLSNADIIPLVELHRTPLDKKDFCLKGNFNPFYKEDRSLADIKARVKLNRELLFIHQ